MSKFNRFYNHRQNGITRNRLYACCNSFLVRFGITMQNDKVSKTWASTAKQHLL